VTPKQSFVSHLNNRNQAYKYSGHSEKSSIFDLPCHSIPPTLSPEGMDYDMYQEENRMSGLVMGT
jgi:hypothetical protein